MTLGTGIIPIVSETDFSQICLIAERAGIDDRPSWADWTAKVECWVAHYPEEAAKAQVTPAAFREYIDSNNGYLRGFVDALTKYAAHVQNKRG